MVTFFAGNYFFEPGIVLIPGLGRFSGSWNFRIQDLIVFCDYPGFLFGALKAFRGILKGRKSSKKSVFDFFLKLAFYRSIFEVLTKKVTLKSHFLVKN